MLGRDFEDEVWSRSVFELASNPIGYFGKMNSTLGSVVPLAMFNFQIGGVLILPNSIIKEVVGVFQPMMRMHSCIPSLVRMEKNMKYWPFLLVVIQPARADSVAQRIDAKNHSCAGQNKIVIMMFQPMMTRKPCDCTTILHERSWKVPKSAKLGRSKYWSVIVTLTETQIHKCIQGVPKNVLIEQNHNQTWVLWG